MFFSKKMKGKGTFSALDDFSVTNLFLRNQASWYTTIKDVLCSVF